MDISAARIPAFGDMQAVSMPPANAAMTDNVLHLRRITAGMRTHVRGIAHELAEHRRAVRNLPAIVANAPDDEIDQAVDQLLQNERALREVWEQTARLCRRLEAKTRQLDSAAYPFVRQITEAAESWYRPYLRFLRDLRWDIMALQSERAPRAHGPVLANASDVATYFRSLPPAA